MGNLSQAVVSQSQYSIAHADMADWVTIAAYLFAAILSARAARQSGLSRKPRERTFWQVTAVLLVLFGINELLDFEMLITPVGRAYANVHGWYEVRDAVLYLV